MDALDAEIRQAESDHGHLRHAEFLADYLALLARLVGAATLVTTESDTYAGHGTVFATETSGSPPEDFARYVEKFRLRTILQKSWMLQLALELSTRVRDVGGWTYEIGETHGAALLTCKAPVVDSLGVVAGGYDIGVQVQHEVLKFFCAPHHYGDRVTAYQNDEIRTILTRVQTALTSSNSRLSSPRRLGFSSFSLFLDLNPATRSIPAWADVLADQLQRLQRANI